MQLYAYHDYDSALQKGMCPIATEDAPMYNKMGYGIHWLPQHSKNGGRKNEDIDKINWWVADIDDGDKTQQMYLINYCLQLPPTIVVETKRGFHCYWRAIDATLDNYERIQLGIAQILNSDTSLKSPSHTLRFPGFLHQKDPNNPFMVKIVRANKSFQYNESLMLKVFKWTPPKYTTNPQNIELQPIAVKDLINPDNWDKYFRLDQITQGNRNNALSNIAYRLAMSGADYDVLKNTLIDINNSMPLPLPIGQVISIANGKKKFLK